MLSPPVVIPDRFRLVFLWARIRIIFHATDGIGPVMAPTEKQEAASAHGGNAEAAIDNANKLTISHSTL